MGVFDPTKAEYWPFADVYIAPLGSPKPANISAAWPSQWKPVGALDGSAGFPLGYGQSVTPRRAWGGYLLRLIRKDDEITVGFTCLEGRRKVVEDLCWPGSTASKLKLRRPQPVLLGLEMVEGGTKKRIIAANYVEVDLDGSPTAKDDDVVAYTFKATFFPNADDEWGIRQPDSTDITLVSLTVAPSTLTVADDEIGRLTATATYSDSSTLDVTASAVWTSSDPTKAIVDHGYVTGTGVGSAVVSAEFIGQSDTCAVTVTS
jgi:hypothetical protein